MIKPIVSLCIVKQPKFHLQTSTAVLFRSKSSKILHRDIIASMDEVTSSVKIQSAQYPKPAGTFAYGTAGFRDKADVLSSTVFRCGILAALRALNCNADTGVMVTASHNPECDNGVKLADPSGGMLDMQWEPAASALANAEDPEEVAAQVQQLIQAQGIQAPQQKEGSDRPLTVFLGRDTRSSSASLAKAARAGVEAVGAALQGAVRVVDCGLVTTPQLHFIVRASNRKELKEESEDSIGMMAAICYYQTLAAGYQALLLGCPASVPSEGEADGSSSSSADAVVMDAANGVGGPKWLELAGYIEAGELRVEVRNSGSGPLNDGCGADFVQKEQKPPCGVGPEDTGRRCVSLDGDADRLVYYSLNSPDSSDSTSPSASTLSFTLLDGDKISALYARYLRTLMADLPQGSSVREATVGVVQTAYANGASTRYLREELGLPVSVTPTGVKHLHKAAEEFDIGIYFEANGHGTILFREEFQLAVKEACQLAGNDDDVASKALLKLKALFEVVNQAVGDALSGVLVVEAILRTNGWGLADWAALYTDLPSRQLKVCVADRGIIETTDAETRVKSPPSLQGLINESVAKYASGRSFVRPSGTEDVVRVYAEASTQEHADALALEVSKHVYSVCGGVGPEP